MMGSEGVILSRLLPWAAATEADWEAVFAEQLPRVHNFFRYRVGDGPDAEDLTSETFERAWRARHRYRRDLAAFTTWLFTIARNLAIDHYRGRRAQLGLEAAAHLPGGRTPEEIAVERSDFDRLSGLLDRLPERERELIGLKYGAGLTNRTIARLNGLSESNVGTILHRTVETLRAGWFSEGVAP